ncbi:flagellar motor switch protein FliM [Leptospirillum ferrooxidans]|uniref:Flagellar motor switch protein FliM n=1 Tax=Leptospirillum ferrooxidans (strain C2-3) TaxID=1162668 RepID=I0ILU6_LEPFC|nr:flagellar motor switch protein FliM [Leptospirillum ferrooxidans]BAM06245.1 putative flagellar motor switch protein [Leptospirillum ferrooxidans C2-3]
MAESILSQDEVNSLLRGLLDGEINTEGHGKEKGEVGASYRYNLASQERIIRGRMPTLEVINDRFSRFFQVTLSGTLRKNIEFVPKGIEMLKFGEFLRKLPMPSNINILRLESLRRNILLIIDARLVYLIVDHILGGNGRGHVKVEGRDFTSIESRITRNILDLAIDDFEKAWAPVYSMPLTYIRSEVNPQFAAIVPPTEMVITLSYMLEIEDQGNIVYICIPYSTIEPIKEKLYTGFQSDQFEVDSLWGIRLRDRIEASPINIQAILGRTTRKVREVLSWKVGDVIALERHISDPIDVNVEGVRRFLARPGTHRGNRAIRIEKRMSPPTVYQEGEEL